MRKRLLVVARDVNLRAAMARWLAPAGFVIEPAESAKKAREVLATTEIAVGILRMEGLDAALLALTAELRRAGSKLIIIGDEIESSRRLRWLGLKVDAFLREPTTQEVVVARVRAVVEPLNEHSDSPGRPEIIHFDGLTLDLSGHSLIDVRGNEVKLTRGEFALLAVLARRPGQVMSRDRLLDAVSGRSAETFDRSIDNLVARLRRKIESDTKKPRLIITVPGAGYKVFLPRATCVQASSTTAASRLSVLVLPFAYPGGSELAGFAEGVTTMLIAALKHIAGGTVLGQDAAAKRAASFAVQEIGREVGVRYVVRGGVRRAGEHLRVNSDMTDARKGVQIWADCIDGKVADLFAFENEVVARIARAIDMELVEVESRSGRDRRGGPDLSDLVTSGQSFLNRPRSAENLCRAREFFQRALRLDDRCPEATAGLAQTHISDALCCANPDPAGQVRLADALATRALETSPRFAYAYHVKGLVLAVQRRHEQSLAAFDMAVQLNPSLAPAHAEIGFTKYVLGRGESALAHAYDGLALARRISPRDPVLANWLYGLGAAHVQAGENAQAICLLNKSIGLNPLPPALAYLAAAYALAGDQAQARNAVGDFTRKWPKETMQTFTMRTQVNRQKFAHSQVYAGLRTAGLPER